MAKPTILLVGGAWHTADYLGPLLEVFEEDGYSATALGLPSVGVNPPATDFSADVNAIRNQCTRLIAEDKEVIAVLHSFGGIPGTEALHGLGKPPGSSAGGVITLVYIASMVPKAGNSFDMHLQAVGDETWGPARQALTHVRILDSNLCQGTAKELINSRVYDSRLTYETYKEIPSGYLLTTNDQAFRYDYQLKTVEMAEFRKR
ncbi:hypothetical protein MMC17_006616 [Xylographa soralifera]|nr:hypothetical protein [Xylographa soralifera]